MDQVLNIYRNTSQGFDSNNDPKGNPIYPYPLPGQQQASSVEADQTFQLAETGLWEPLGPVTENRWSYTLPTFSITSGGTAGNFVLESAYEFPELLAWGGLPSSIYVYFSITFGSQRITNTSDWKCEFDLSKLFETSSFTSPTYYVSEYFACFGARITGKLLDQFTEPPKISVKVDAFYLGTPFDDQFFLNNTVTGSAGALS